MLSCFGSSVYIWTSAASLATRQVDSGSRHLPAGKGHVVPYVLVVRRRNYLRFEFITSSIWQSFAWTQMWQKHSRRLLGMETVSCKGCSPEFDRRPWRPEKQPRTQIAACPQLRPQPVTKSMQGLAETATETATAAKCPKKVLR